MVNLIKKMPIKIFLAIIILSLSVILVSCNEVEPSLDKKISVMVSEGEGFSINGDYCKEILPGEDVEFLINVDEGYVIEDENYANSRYFLSRVTFPTFINLNIREKAVVNYIIHNDDLSGDFRTTATN